MISMHRKVVLDWVVGQYVPDYPNSELKTGMYRPKKEANDTLKKDVFLFLSFFSLKKRTRKF